MRAALIDVVEWQTTVNLEDGRPIQVDGHLADIAREVVSSHPYPGDFADSGSRWVTDVALHLNDQYQPEFMMVVFASPFFASVFNPTTEAEREEVVRGCFREIDRFITVSGFEPLVIGLGDLVPTRGPVDISDLTGLAMAGGMSPRFAGLYGVSEPDLDKLAGRTGIERVVDRKSFRERFGGCDEFYKRFPDHLAVASEGFYFKGLGSGARPLYRTPAYDSLVPLHTDLGRVDSITGVPDLVLGALQEGKRVALVLVEAVGLELFPLKYRHVLNTCHWYRYAVGEGQYLVITTGRHFVEFPYPPGFRYYVEDGENKRFPLSGIFSDMPSGTISQRWQGRSAAVGNRSILTHVSAGADITVECLARGLYNHGVMAVLDLDNSPS